MDDVNGKRPRSPRVKSSAPSRRDFCLPFFLRTASKTLGKKNLPRRFRMSEERANVLEKSWTTFTIIVSVIFYVSFAKPIMTWVTCARTYSLRTGFECGYEHKPDKQNAVLPNMPC